MERLHLIEDEELVAYIKYIKKNYSRYYLSHDRLLPPEIAKEFFNLKITDKMCQAFYNHFDIRKSDIPRFEGLEQFVLFLRKYGAPVIKTTPPPVSIPVIPDFNEF